MSRSKCIIEAGVKKMGVMDAGKTNAMIER